MCMTVVSIKTMRWTANGEECANGSHRPGVSHTTDWSMESLTAPPSSDTVTVHNCVMSWALPTDYLTSSSLLESQCIELFHI